MKKLIYLFVIIMLMSGCATPSVYIHSDADSDYKFSQQSDKIFVGEFENADIRKRTFRSFLIEELKDVGFNVVNKFEEADYILVSILDQNTSRIDSYHTVSTPIETKGSISTYGDVYVSGDYSQTTTVTQEIPYSYYYTVKRLRVFIRSVKDIKADIASKNVWEAHLGAEAEDYEKYAKECVATLLSYYGKNFAGYVNIKTKQKKK